MATEIYDIEPHHTALDEWPALTIHAESFADNTALVQQIWALSIQIQKAQNNEHWVFLHDLCGNHANGELTTEQVRMAIWEELIPHYPAEPAVKDEKKIYIPKGFRDVASVDPAGVNSSYYSQDYEKLTKKMISNAVVENQMGKDFFRKAYEQHPEKFEVVFDADWLFSYLRQRGYSEHNCFDVFHEDGELMHRHAVNLHGNVQYNGMHVHGDNHPVEPYSIYLNYVESKYGGKKVEPTQEDNVNHPAHYTHYQGIEVIDIRERLSNNRGDAVKYICRAGHKDITTELEDLKKALWYLEREQNYISQSTFNNTEIIATPLMMKLVAQMSYNRGNAVEYICMSTHSGDLGDCQQQLAMAHSYLKHEIERLSSS